MSYCSHSKLPTSPRRVIEIIELLGYRPAQGFKLPHHVASYYWYEEEEYKSWSGIELDIYRHSQATIVETRTTISRSYWDLHHQNLTIKLLRDLFGGSFSTDEGNGRYLRPRSSPPTPLASGCYLARWRFETSMTRAKLYLDSRELNGTLAKAEPTGITHLDALNPRLLSNNLLIPYIIGTWEEYFRATFIALLRHSQTKDGVLKRARFSYQQVDDVASKLKTIEEAIADTFNFQRPSQIGENFRTIDPKLDIAAAFRAPYRRRKMSLYDSIEELVESRHKLVHTGTIDMSLYDKEVKLVMSDITCAVDRAYRTVAQRFSFEPIID